MNKMLLVLAVLALWYFWPYISDAMMMENFAGNPGTLDQLATSRPYIDVTDPYQFRNNVVFRREPIPHHGGRRYTPKDNSKQLMYLVIGVLVLYIVLKK